MTERSSRGLPSPSQVIELLGDEFARAGYEIEDVSIESSMRPPRITVIADGDTALDLETIAKLSRVSSELMDTIPEIADEYVLEVSSPGVERPLTSAKHFRRARARLVELTLHDGSQVSGRVGALDGGVLRLVVKGRKNTEISVREIPLDDIAEAVVQVEFSTPSPRELELVGQTGTSAGATRTEAGA